MSPDAHGRSGVERVSIDRTGRSAASYRVPHHEIAVTPDEAPPPQNPEAVEFVRFCYRRRRVSWPELYDEMCACAARGTYRGLTYEELESLGVNFTLPGMAQLVALADRVVTEERRRLGRVGGPPADERAQGVRPNLLSAPG
jgi:hypothetical protein